MKHNAVRIIRWLSPVVVEIAPTYPGEPVLRIRDEETGELIRLSCSDKHNDGIILALLKVHD